LDFLLPIKSYNILRSYSSGQVDLEDIDIVLEISLLRCLHVLSLSSGVECAIINVYFRSDHAVFPMSQLDC